MYTACLRIIIDYMKNKGILLQIRKLESGRSEKDAQKIAGFFARLEEKGPALRSRMNLLFHHFLASFEYCLDHGLSVDETAELLSPERFGDYFSREDGEYYTLDNAAIVYPLGMKFGQMPMFRLSVTLKDDVVPCLLQTALDFTIRRFPVFSAVVRTGFFWHYLETTHQIPEIEEETEIPCKPISIRMRSSRSYRVVYFKKRISVEFFHVLTDGSGGMVFLKTLLREYFRLLGKEIPCTEEIRDVEEEAPQAEFVNEFENAKGEDNLDTFFDSPSVQLDGKLTSIKPSRVLHFIMDSNQLKNVSHRYGGTVTSYLLAVMMEAAQARIAKKQGIYKIQVPVNMRKFNHSQTLRNYSMYFFASTELSEHPTREERVKDMAKQIQEKGSEGIMTQMMKTTGRMIRTVSWIPVFLKAPVVQIAYGYLGNRIIGETLSNLGVIRVPEEMKPYIDGFDFLLVPGSPNRAASTLVSFEGTTRFTVIKASKDSRYEENILRILEEDGLTVRMEGSIDYES